MDSTDVLGSLCNSSEIVKNNNTFVGNLLKNDPKTEFIRQLKRENKSDDDIEKMIKYMETSGMLKQKVLDSLINRYTDMPHRKKICKVFKYKRLNRGDVLFSKGDEGDAAYLILSGSLAIYSLPALKQFKKEVEQVLIEDYIHEDPGYKSYVNIESDTSEINVIENISKAELVSNNNHSQSNNESKTPTSQQNNKKPSNISKKRFKNKKVKSPRVVIAEDSYEEILNKSYVSTKNNENIQKNNTQKNNTKNDEKSGINKEFKEPIDKKPCILIDGKSTPKSQKKKVLLETCKQEKDGESKDFQEENQDSIESNMGAETKNVIEQQTFLNNTPQASIFESVSFISQRSKLPKSTKKCSSIMKQANYKKCKTTNVVGLVKSKKDDINHVAEEIEPTENRLLSLKSGGIMFVALTNYSIIGEMSQENNNPRNASALATDQVELLKIEKKDYLHFFKEINMEEKQKKMDLINSCMPEIKETSLSSLVSVAYSMRQVKLPKGSVIYGEDQIYNKCYQISEGMVLVRKALDTNYLKEVSDHNIEAICEVDNELLKRLDEHLNARVSLSDCKLKHVLDLCFLGRGQTIGEESFLESKDLGLSVFSDNPSELKDNNIKNFGISKPIYQCKKSRFIYEAKTDVVAFVIYKSDIQLSSLLVQHRIKRDYVIKHLQRYNMYLNTALRMIMEVSGGNKKGMESVDQIKMYQNPDTLETKYKTAKKAAKNMTVTLSKSKELFEINELQGTQIYRKDKLKKRKFELDTYFCQQAKDQKIESTQNFLYENTNENMNQKYTPQESVDNHLYDSINRQSLDILEKNTNIEKLKANLKTMLRADKKVFKLQKQDLTTRMSKDMRSTTMDTKSNFRDNYGLSTKKSNQKPISPRNFIKKQSEHIRQDMNKTGKTNMNNSGIYNTPMKITNEKEFNFFPNDFESSNFSALHNKKNQTFQIQTNKSLLDQSFNPLDINTAKAQSVDNDIKFKNRKVNFKNIMKWLKPTTKDKFGSVNGSKMNTQFNSFDDLENTQQQEDDALKRRSRAISIDGQQQGLKRGGKNLELINESMIYRKEKGQRHYAKYKINQSNQTKDGLRHTLPIKKLSNLITGVNLKKHSVVANYTSKLHPHESSFYKVKGTNKDGQPHIDSQNSEELYDERYHVKNQYNLNTNQISLESDQIHDIEPPLIGKHNFSIMTPSPSIIQRDNYKDQQQNLDNSIFYTFDKKRIMTSRVADDPRIWTNDSNWNQNRKSSKNRKIAPVKGNKLPNGSIMGELKIFLN